MTVLRHILLLQRDVPKAAQFYSQGLGLPLKVLTDRWAELQAGTTVIALKAVEGCARWQCTFMSSAHRLGLMNK